MGGGGEGLEERCGGGGGWRLSDGLVPSRPPVASWKETDQHHDYNLDAVFCLAAKTFSLFHLI